MPLGINKEESLTKNDLFHAGIARQPAMDAKTVHFSKNIELQSGNIGKRDWGNLEPLFSRIELRLHLFGSVLRPAIPPA